MTTDTRLYSVQNRYVTGPYAVTTFSEINFRDSFFYMFFYIQPASISECPCYLPILKNQKEENNFLLGLTSDTSDCTLFIFVILVICNVIGI